VVLCFIMAVAAGTALVAAKDKDKNHGKSHKCEMKMKCKDNSDPNNGMCADGTEAIAALACQTKPNTPTNCCYSWQTGVCDVNNPAARCKSVSNPNGTCECRCML
jgi:hypothetical protein